MNIFGRMPLTWSPHTDEHPTQLENSEGVVIAAIMGDEGDDHLNNMRAARLARAVNFVHGVSTFNIGEPYEKRMDSLISRAREIVKGLNDET